FCLRCGEITIILYRNASSVVAWAALLRFYDTSSSITSIREQFPSDNHTLDFGSTLVDLGDFSIAHQPLHVVFFDVPVPAVDLYSLYRGFHGYLRRIQLRHGSGLTIRLAMVFEPCRFQAQ